MRYNPHNMKGSIQGKGLSKGPKAGAQEREILDDPSGINPDHRSSPEALGDCEETAYCGIQSNPGRPEQSQAEDEDRYPGNPLSSARIPEEETDQAEGDEKAQYSHPRCREKEAEYHQNQSKPEQKRLSVKG